MDSRDFLFLPIEFSILILSVSLLLEPLSQNIPTVLLAWVAVSSTLAIPPITFFNYLSNPQAEQKRRSV
jgi:hypothetical protein